MIKNRTNEIYFRTTDTRTILHVLFLSVFKVVTS